jgi:hypothetical protein
MRARPLGPEVLNIARGQFQVALLARARGGLRSAALRIGARRTLMSSLGAHRLDARQNPNLESACLGNESQARSEVIWAEWRRGG